MSETTSVVPEAETIKNIGDLLKNECKPLPERFRALFTLRNLGGQVAVDCIAQCFNDPSALLKHECAYCLGQMQDKYAIPTLCKVLSNKNQEAMVRHEAGEALGAIGCPSVLDTLKQYSNDPVIEVAETCLLAVKRIEWKEQESSMEGNIPASTFNSVDPAPPSVETDIHKLKATLLDEGQPLFKRYRAMFSLRNKGGPEAVGALGEGLKCKSALFRHEVAYVLGQMQDEGGIQQLLDNLKDKDENAMVRHECAEALGAIASKECIDILQNYLTDDQRVVKESCQVALDICDYENSGQLQYADGLNRVLELKHAPY